MAKSFKQLLAMVLSKFGIDALPKKDGKSALTDEMKAKLTADYGEKFVSKFESELAEMNEEGDVPNDAEIKTLKDQLADMKAQFEKAEQDKQTLQGKVDTLSIKPEDDEPEVIPVGNAGKRPAFKPNMAYMHNKVIDAYFRGDTSMMYSGSDTINTSELQADFGKYITGIKLDIYKQLTTGLTITRYMTPITTDKTEWRAMQSIITSVLQQFTPKWTPLGNSKFTPLTIKNYFHKVNFPITPSDIIDQYIGYMYNETVTPDQMPIVKFIIDQLLLPKLLEDIETAFVHAKFVEFNPTEDGETPPADSSLQSMDGVLTILKAKKAGSSKITWLADGVTLTRENIVDEMEKSLDNIAPLYRKKKMLIHADPDLIKLYSRAYRDKYPQTKNEDGEKVRVDFTNFSFVPVEGAIATGAFWLTPKENWIHLLSRNPNEARIFMQLQNYNVKVFMEFRMSTGFAIEEAIFAYLPPTEESGFATGSTGGGI
jgi:hypothetical protein